MFPQTQDWGSGLTQMQLMLLSSPNSISASNLFSQFISSVNLCSDLLNFYTKPESELFWGALEKRKRKLKNVLGIYQSRLQKSQELLLLRLLRAAAIRLYLEPMAASHEGNRRPLLCLRKQKTQASERTKIGGLLSQGQRFFLRELSGLPTKRVRALTQYHLHSQVTVTN